MLLAAPPARWREFRKDFVRSTRTQLVAKCRGVTPDQIAKVDKELLADRYEVVIVNSYQELASGFFRRTLAKLISESRRNGRIKIQGSRWFLLHTDAIVNEYDYEVDLVRRIRREGSPALTESYATYLSEHSSKIAALALEETLAAMVKHRTGSQDLIDGVWVDVAP